MTSQPESWYVDRLRAELERAARNEDQRERRGALGRLRLPSRWPAAILAGAVVAAIIAIAGLTLRTPDEERTATPAPAVAPATDPDATLRRLDGLYVAEISAATLRQIDLEPGAVAGWWRIVVRSSERTFTLSAPEGPGSGDYTLDITAVEPTMLTFAPDTGCPQREGRTASSVEFSLSQTGVLTLRNSRGGCRPDWNLMTSTTWFRG